MQQLLRLAKAFETYNIISHSKGKQRDFLGGLFVDIPIKLRHIRRVVQIKQVIQKSLISPLNHKYCIFSC